MITAVLKKLSRGHTKEKIKNKNKIIGFPIVREKRKREVVGGLSKIQILSFTNVRGSKVFTPSCYSLRCVIIMEMGQKGLPGLIKFALRASN